LLLKTAHVRRVLKLLDRVTRNLAGSRERRSESFVALKKGLAYCWSVAVAALPDEGRRAMEKWFASQDADVRRVMRENLGKARLRRMDPDWVERWERKLR
jgi:hypothetical protein